MKTLIYGGGAVGLGIAGCLLKAGHDVDILARQAAVTLLQSQGLLRQGIFGHYHAPPDAFRAFTALDLLPSAVYDYILVCTKSFDSAAAAADLRGCPDLFSAKTAIVLFQNGWGNAEKFLAFFTPHQICNARVITGFQRTAENSVDITVHADDIHIGCLFSRDILRLEPLAHAISKGDIPCSLTDDIGKDLWEKMLYNCALNPLGAVLDVPYGTLAENDYTRSIMNAVIEEIFAVIAAAGFSTHWQNPADYLDLFYSRLVPATAAHKSSTLQSILAGKNTEIDSLNGSVIKLAQKHNTPTPANRVLYNLIKFLESRNRHQKPDPTF